MRLNPDCVRDTMLALEDAIMIDEYGNTIEVDYRDVPNPEKLSSYNNAESFTVTLIPYAILQFSLPSIHTLATSQSDLA